MTMGRTLSGAAVVMATVGCSPPSHKLPAELTEPLRQVVYVGPPVNAEVSYLRAGDATGFGALWYLSHDGDRLVCHDDEFRELPWEYDVSDDYLDGLIADLARWRCHALDRLCVIDEKEC